MLTRPLLRAQSPRMRETLQATKTMEGPLRPALRQKRLPLLPGTWSAKRGRRQHWIDSILRRPWIACDKPAIGHPGARGLRPLLRRQGFIARHVLCGQDVLPAIVGPLVQEAVGAVIPCQLRDRH